jgi:hypothetical protein
VEGLKGNVDEAEAGHEAILNMWNKCNQAQNSVGLSQAEIQRNIPMEHDPLGHRHDALLRLIERRQLGANALVRVCHLGKTS